MTSQALEYGEFVALVALKHGDLATLKRMDEPTRATMLQRGLMSTGSDEFDVAGFAITNKGRAILQDITDSRQVGQLRGIVADIEREMQRQEKKFGVQNHDDLYWLAILMEEVGEVAKARLEENQDQMRIELIQCAAVIVTWLKSQR